MLKRLWLVVCLMMMGTFPIVSRADDPAANFIITLSEAPNLGFSTTARNAYATNLFKSYNDYLNGLTLKVSPVGTGPGAFVPLAPNSTVTSEKTTLSNNFLSWEGSTAKATGPNANEKGTAMLANELAVATNSAGIRIKDLGFTVQSNDSAHRFNVALDHLILDPGLFIRGYIHNADGSWTEDTSGTNDTFYGAIGWIGRQISLDASSANYSGSNDQRLSQAMADMTTGTGGTELITFRYQTTTTDGRIPTFATDTLSIVQPTEQTPEPTSFSVIALCFAGFALRRSRR